MKRDEWIWMPHPAHLVVAWQCRFHLATYVGGYIVSTVGEWLPEAGSREICALARRVVLEGKGDARLADYMEKVGYEDVGYGRKYETMVFQAEPREGGGCCPWVAADWSELDMRGYNDPAFGTRGHLELCEKWADREAAVTTETAL